MRSKSLVALLLVTSLAAGCGGGSDAAENGGTTDRLEVTGTDGLRFEPSSLSAGAGQVEVELSAGPGVGHTFVVEGVAGDEPVVEADAGGSSTGSVELPAGSYTVYCSISGHREAGMEASLDVAA